jgi:transcriptional regulator with XRE-family HTH domain
MPQSAPSLGDHLRAWRRQRRMSQLDLACEAAISSRHLSFIETGRSKASREMVLRLAEHLEAPPRQANAMLIAAGYAPVFPEHALSDPALNEARGLIDVILKSQAPSPPSPSTEAGTWWPPTAPCRNCSRASARPCWPSR